MCAERILITGGAGYLGSVITGHLLRDGNEVTWLDTLRYGQQSPLCFAAHKNFAFIEGDARDSSLLRELVSFHDTLLPLAAIVGAPACDAFPEDARTTNTDAVVMLNTLRSPSQKLIYPTTNSGYGTTTGEIHCTEDSPLRPVSLYGETKAAAERALLEDSKPCIAFRLATVFGISPRPRLDLLVNDLTFRALKEKKIEVFEGQYMRNFVHIKDVARVFIHALEHYSALSHQRLYNVGNPELNISKAALAQKIAAHVPSVRIVEDHERKDPDQRNYIVSNQRLLNTGFAFQHSLDDGIKELIRAYPMLHTPALQRIAYNAGRKR